MQYIPAGTLTLARVQAEVLPLTAPAALGQVLRTLVAIIHFTRCGATRRLVQRWLINQWRIQADGWVGVGIPSMRIDRLALIAGAAVTCQVRACSRRAKAKKIKRKTTNIKEIFAFGSAFSRCERILIDNRVIGIVVVTNE